MSEESNVGEVRKQNERDVPTTSRDAETTRPRIRQCTKDGVFVKICSTDDVSTPPIYISLEEFIQATQDLENMYLVHEIAHNKDFRFEKSKKNENSVEKNLNDVYHKAYWDVLRRELGEDPPNYKYALLLLRTMRSELLSLSPKHEKIEQQISEVLDMELIGQQATAKTLDCQQYAQYVIAIMAQMCAPVRDEKIAELGKLSDVVDMFKGIFEVIELMKMDLANFTMDFMRPHIMACSIEYEKQKFATCIRLNGGALNFTEAWLKEHCKSVEDSAEDFNKTYNAVLNNAYIEFLEWDFPNKPFPETVMMDQDRLLAFGKESKKVTLAGAILLLTYASAGPDLSSIAEFKDLLRNHILTLMDNFEKEESGDLRAFLTALAAKLKRDLMDAVDKYGVRVGDPQFSDLDAQIGELANGDHKILILLKQRLKQFLANALSSQSPKSIKVPTGFSSLEKEIYQLAMDFVRFTSYNRAVHDDFYKKFVQEHREPRGGTGTGTGTGFDVNRET